MLKKTLAVCGVILLVGCSDIPKEVPELSYTVGQDIAAMQASHISLIKALFHEMKQRRIDYVDDVWAPLFVQKFVSKGRLRDIAAGTVVWDDAAQDFVTPKPATAETALVSSIVFWGQAAIKQIAAKKAKLLAPLNAKEAKLLAEVDAGYTRILAANSQITAFITTLRGVQELDDQLLKTVGLGDLRMKIHNEMVQISGWAESSLAKVKDVDQKVLKTQKIIGDL